MEIIAITGKTGVGKTELSKILCQRLIKQQGERWTKMAFADALKDEVSEIFKFPLIWCYHGKNKIVHISGFDNKLTRLKSVRGLKTLSVRRILQLWGTDVRRSEDLNYWVDKMHVKLKDAQKSNDGVIVDDVRFESELHMLSCFDRFAIRLNPYQGHKCDLDVASHESENALDDYCCWQYEATPDFGTLPDCALKAYDDFIRERTIQRSIREKENW